MTKHRLGVRHLLFVALGTTGLLTNAALADATVGYTSGSDVETGDPILPERRTRLGRAPARRPRTWAST